MEQDKIEVVEAGVSVKDSTGKQSPFVLLRGHGRMRGGMIQINTDIAGLAILANAGVHIRRPERTK